jgi:putative transposase
MMIFLGSLWLLIVMVWVHLKHGFRLIFDSQKPNKGQPFRRKASDTSPPNKAKKHERKPAWIVDYILRAKAWNPHASCRAISHQFNRAYLDSGFSISKSFVANKLKEHGAKLAQLRSKWRQNPPAESNRNQTWAMDLTFATDISKEQRIILGIIDHGTRANLALCELANKSTITILSSLIDCLRKFGLPKQIRVDNEPCFHGFWIQITLAILGVKLNAIAPNSPWQNGRIERFFGSFKRDFERIIEGDLPTLLAQWRWYYNFAGPHQHLNYKTPAEAWSKKPKATCEPRAIELWNGQLKFLYFESG